MWAVTSKVIGVGLLILKVHLMRTCALDARQVAIEFMFALLGISVTLVPSLFSIPSFLLLEWECSF
jgi:hypothetical protein